MDTPRNRIPLWLKLLYTAFMAVLVPVYWANYGPTNFLYFCDIALFFTLIALWTESRLLTSIPAVGIVLPQLLWCVDYLCGLFGYFPLGMTSYMFNAELDFFLRSLSLFHGWLPLLLIYMVARVGYDGRAFRWWWAVAWVAMGIAFFFLPAVKDPQNVALPYNVNYVYGVDDPQTFWPPWAWFLMVLFVVPIVFAGPSHWVMKRWRGGGVGS